MLPSSDSTPDDDDLLAVDAAGNIAGIPPRTLRYWIKNGKLPATAGQRGKLVRMGDVRRLAILTGRTSGNVGNRGNTLGGNADGKPGNVAGNAWADELDAGDHGNDGNPLPASSAVAASAQSQLAAIRDEWLAPLIEQIETLARENGRLQERNEAAERRAVEAAATAIIAQAAANEASRLRQVEADQADQLVNLLEDQINDLRQRLKESGNDGERRGREGAE